MDYSEGMDDSATVFYVGQHEPKRTLNASAELVQHAQDLGVGPLILVSQDIALTLLV